MQFHDRRSDPSLSLSPRMARLLAAVVLKEMPHDARFVPKDKRDLAGLHVSFHDSDPDLGAVEHLGLNFEPDWLTDDFRTEWRELHGTTLQGRMLRNGWSTGTKYALWEER